jgi:hypothetical protein
MPGGTIVDSNVILDIFTDDPLWGDWPAAFMRNTLRLRPSYDRSGHPWARCCGQLRRIGGGGEIGRMIPRCPAPETEVLLS